MQSKSEPPKPRTELDVKLKFIVKKDCWQKNSPFQRGFWSIKTLGPIAQLFKKISRRKTLIVKFSAIASFLTALLASYFAYLQFLADFELKKERLQFDKIVQEQQTENNKKIVELENEKLQLAKIVQDQQSEKHKQEVEVNEKKSSEERRVDILNETFSTTMEQITYALPKLEISKKLVSDVEKAFRRPKMVLLEGYNSIGKTSFCKEYLIQKQKEGLPVLYYSVSGFKKENGSAADFYSALFGFDVKVGKTIEGDEFKANIVSEYLLKFKKTKVYL